jgi:hypothetical protein
VSSAQGDDSDAGCDGDERDRDRRSSGDDLFSDDDCGAGDRTGCCRLRTLTTMRIAFLLGSGISADAGMPSVDTISTRVLAGKGVIRHSDATYYLAESSEANYDHYRAAAEPAIRFAQRLNRIADCYFADILDGRSANYEDVANLAKQVTDAISGEYENPALLPLLAELQRHVTNLPELATETQAYIRDVVWRMLSRTIDRVDHLAAIIDACRALSALDLFELNHDRVLETALARAGVVVSDGFTRKAGDVLFWTDEFTGPIRHFKLHGSITWFARSLPEEPWRGLIVARSKTEDPYHERGADGELLEFPADGRPVMLTGTFDKPLTYDSTTYADQHYRFHESLRSANALVVIGYGFRDKAINSRLISWIHGARNHRLVVVHGDVAGLVARSRSAVARQWNDWINQGRLQVVEKWIADVTWSDIGEALNRKHRH